MPNPDAVMVPAGYLKGNLSDKLLAAKAEFGPILGGTKAYVGRACVHDAGGHNFITAHPDDTLLHPTGHEFEKQPRYTWVDRGDGVQYGTLAEGAEDHRVKT